MICAEIQRLLSAWHDGEMDPPTRAQVEAHVALCGACRLEAEALARQDSVLRLHFDRLRPAADRVIAGVEAWLPLEATQLATPSPDDIRGVAPSRRLLRTLGTHLACVAVGMLLALLAIRSTPRSETESPPGTDRMPNASPVAATLTLATGPVEYRPRSATDWIAWTPGLTCPSDATVRTAGDALAELTTADDCVVRLDRGTEVAFDTPAALTLHQGKIWCRAPEGKRVEIRAPDDPPAQPSLSCVGQGATWSVAQTDRAWECLSAVGDVVVAEGNRIRTLAPGEAVRIEGEARAASPLRVDQIEASRWMRPLLVRKGPESAELEGHVDALLAMLGATKVAWLGESELRALGEPGALPILRYVQSPASRENVQRREAAVRILADVAPPALVSDLIGLLEDDSPAVRVAAARGLHRLTGETHGRAADAWNDDPNANASAIAAWRLWWKDNEARYRW